MQVSLNTLTALAAANQPDAQKAIAQWLSAIYAYDAKMIYLSEADAFVVAPRLPYGNEVDPITWK